MTSDRTKNLETTAKFTFPAQKHYVSDIDETGLGAVDVIADDPVPASLWGGAWKCLCKRSLFWIAAIIVAFSIIMATFLQLFTRIDPNFYELSNSCAPPKAGHLFGYDRQDYDIFVRTIRGARASAIVGLLTTFMMVIIGGAFGTLAGFFGDFVDAFLSRAIDTIFAVPFILAAIVVVQIFRNNRTIFTIALVLAVFGWPSITRITRGAVMQTKNKEFATTAKALGENKWKIILRHIVPSAIAPMIVYAIVILGTSIISKATLSFLGVGLPSNVVSWGGDISRAQTTPHRTPQVLLYPTRALALTALSFIVMGDVVRDALDPKTRKR